MLEEITIQALGVIDSSSAEFGPGLTVLTGETGAGKTMIVTSLHLLSGARADASRVRTGSAKATVEGRFRIPASAELAELLDSAGAESDEDGTVIASRSVSSDGRSRAHLGGRSVPVGLLGRFTTSVLTVHGQNDQLRLLKPEHQRDALDRFGGPRVSMLLDEYRAANATWRLAADRLRARRSDARERAQEADRLRFGLDEIAAVDPRPGEDVELAGAIRRLSDLETLRDSAMRAYEVLTGGENETPRGGVSSVLEGLGAVRGLLDGVEDETLRSLLPSVSDALSVVADIGTELSDYLSGLPVDASELEKLLARQADVKSLIRKYAPDIDGVISWRDEASRRLAALDDPGESIEELEAAEVAARERVASVAVTLTAARRKAATALARQVSAELSGLAMGDTTIEVSVSADCASSGDPWAIEVGGRSVHAGSAGVDRVEFGLVAHSGAPALPIAKSASGGELSRVMLALEVVLAAGGEGATMVFDEVDAGVGGHAAVQIGKRLAGLASDNQVIVVTHLPQVAAFADRHLHIGKQAVAGHGRAVTSSVTELDRSGRIAELARMLAGLGDSETGRAHAEELLSTAESEKETVAVQRRSRG